jgi:putative membrane protein
MLKPVIAAAMLSLAIPALVPAPALAQASKASLTKAEFVRMAASGDMFEIESGKLALSNADSAEVKQFAQKLIDDHTAASKKLMSFTDQKPPATLDKKHADMLSKLKSSTGKEFTQTFITLQLQAHKEAVQLFEQYAKDGDDAKLKSFASDTLPALREHLQHAQKLQKSG